MRLIHYLLVAVVFIVVAAVGVLIAQAAGWEHSGLPLVIAAILGSQLGAVLWHKAEPTANLRTVKLRLGILLSIVAVAFSIVLQLINAWFEYPEIVIPIAAIGCFGMPFALAGQMWNTLNESALKKKLQAKSPSPNIFQADD